MEILNLIEVQAHLEWTCGKVANTTSRILFIPIQNQSNCPLNGIQVDSMSKQTSRWCSQTTIFKIAQNKQWLVSQKPPVLVTLGFCFINTLVLAKIGGVEDGEN